MGWRRVVGKLLLVCAGSGVLVVLVFVGLPLVTQMLEPQEPLAPEEIVGEVLGTPAAEEGEQGDADSSAEEGVMRAPSSVVAVRNNGEEIAVVFPAVGGEEPQDGAPVAGDGPTDDERDAAQGATLPPVLSPEEVADAMAGLEGSVEDSGEAAAGAQVMADVVGEVEGSDAEGAWWEETLDWLSGTGEEPVQGDGWQPEVVVLKDLEDSRHVEVTFPPPSATRDVQELLETLGYAPGPLDGIWGERTEGAWRSFARDAADLAVRTELAQAEPAQVEPEDAVDASVAEVPPPSGAAVDVEGDGERQAGGTRPRSGLPQQESGRPVVVPGTLRGVMGYRMPLVSRQGVPDQVVSGVLIPAHTTFVILKPGYWELVDLEPGEVERLRKASAPREPAVDERPVKGRWNPLRLFRRQGSSTGPVRPGEVKESRP